MVCSPNARCESFSSLSANIQFHYGHHLAAPLRARSARRHFNLIQRLSLRISLSRLAAMQHGLPLGQPLEHNGGEPMHGNGTRLPIPYRPITHYVGAHQFGAVHGLRVGHCTAGKDAFPQRKGKVQESDLARRWRRRKCTGGQCGAPITASASFTTLLGAAQSLRPQDWRCRCCGVCKGTCGQRHVGHGRLRTPHRTRVVAMMERQ